MHWARRRCIAKAANQYAALRLQMPDGKGPTDTRVLANMWIDDIALDTKRVGCIAGQAGAH